MSRMLHIVVACAENRVIGRDGRLPWRIPEDVAHFCRLTAGNICVLGRICFDTWPDATRDGRQPIVLTSRPIRGEVPPPRGNSEPAARRDEAAPAARSSARVESRSRPIMVRSFDAALTVAESVPGDLFVCGGERVFAEALAQSRPLRLHLTLVHAEFSGDRHFPEWRNLAWSEVERRDSADANYRYTFLTLDRVQ